VVLTSMIQGRTEAVDEVRLPMGSDWSAGLSNHPKRMPARKRN
jgi:hypothetical protein